ncbi:nectin-3-like protein isoform X1 [Clupea harengus]|uniref:Nectin cell adhesion molecule 3 n=1 Tax=Clupea harengus TaxID=7950 RepID=A0A6P3W2N4_CLUHA|nr:nectin-3-like protein isoform X1 [Clupea harengus]
MKGSAVVHSKSGLVSMELLLRRILSYRNELESSLGDMERRMSARYFRNNPYSGGNTTVALLLLTASGVLGNQVLVPPRISAVLGKNVTLGCRVEVDSNLSLTQSSWERRLPSGSVTLAVYNPVHGISVPPEYQRRLSFRSPSSHDATIVLEDVGFADIGIYTCKVATFPLGNTQASTTVSVMVEPKVYVSAGSVALVDGGNETTVATCIAERARPPADVSWETDLHGASEAHLQDEANGTTTTQVQYMWHPARHGQGHTLTCVVRHPALQADFRVPYLVSVLFAPDIVVLGYDGDWFVGRENLQLTCQAKANPSAHHFRWVRLDGEMPEGVVMANDSLVFGRPLQRNDSGVYRCEVGNDIGFRSRDIRIRVHDPPTTTMFPTIYVPVLKSSSNTTTPNNNKQGAIFTSPTLAPLPEGNLGTILGGAVGGALFLLLLLVLGVVYYQRQRGTFRGNYYTKQYLGPSDMQKAPPPAHELHQVYGAVAGNGGLEMRPSRDAHGGGDGSGFVYRDKDREEWGDCDRERAPNGRSRALREELTGSRQDYHDHHDYQNHYNHHNQQHHHPSHYQSYHDDQRGNHQPGPRRCPPPHVVNNGSPYFPEEVYDNEYVSHTDGSMISRREWYV